MVEILIVFNFLNQEMRVILITLFASVMRFVLKLWQLWILATNSQLRF